MSYYDYYIAFHLKNQGHSVKSLIMTAMFRADVPQLTSLIKAFPLIYNEWKQRTRSPDGLITERERTVYGDPGEPE